MGLSVLGDGCCVYLAVVSSKRENECVYGQCGFREAILCIDTG